MVESNQRSLVVEKDIKSVLETIQLDLGTEWSLLFNNFSEEQAELLYLGGYTGIGGLFFPVNKSIIFIKLFRRDKLKTEIVVVTGGRDSVEGWDLGKYKRLINRVLKPFEKPQK